MNLNNIYKPEPADTNNDNFCDRVKLDTGTNCNYKCHFCYYLDKLHLKTSFEEIKKRIDYFVECGISEVDLSGGESSIHDSWFEILDYCKSKNLKISCLSNGSMFAKKDFIQKSKDHGLQEILFSLHGYNDETHNKIVGNKKGFEKIIKAISNAKEIGIKVRLNCTVTKDNYLELDTIYADLLNQIKPNQINFLTLNYWDKANDLESFSYAESTPVIKRTIDKIKDNIANITVRYTPYCYMTGYEKYVCSTYGHIYDKGDWNIALYHRNVDPADYIKNKKQIFFDTAFKNRKLSYIKPVKCKDCKWLYICDGTEKENKVFPVPGEKIKSVL